MDKFRILKNGLVLTLDKLHRAGYYTIVLKNNKIAEIDFDRRFNIENFLIKYPETEVVDCEGKLLSPAFINCSNNTIHNLLRFFIKKATLDDLDDEGSRRSINNLLLSEENHYALKSLGEISYTRSLLRGESITIDTSEIYDTGDAEDKNKKTYHLINSEKILPDSVQNEENKFLIPSLGRNDEINNYSLSSFKKKGTAFTSLSYLQLFKSCKRIDELKGLLGKSVIKTFYELNILNKNSLIADPVDLNASEIELLAEKKIPVLLEPSDIKRFCASKAGISGFFGKKLSIVVGTGSSGNDLLSELRQLSLLANANLTTYEELLKTVTINPAAYFNMEEKRGTLEKNKIADIIIWDVNSFSNALDIPEIDSEMICEFIIEKLTINDLRKLIISGIDELDEQSSLRSDSKKLKELLKKLYGTEKYLEIKERELFRKRPGNDESSETSILIEREEREKYENIPIESISEFKLKGALVLEGVEEIADELAGEMPVEISSIDEGLNLLDEVLVFSEDNELSNKEYLSTKEFDGPVSVNKISEIKKPVKKIFFDDEAISAEDNKEKSSLETPVPKITKPVETISKPSQVTNKENIEVPPQNKEVKFKPSKLKFGFSNDEGKEEPR
ncbi:hypothetical protein BH10BAC5_BH10BAC5_22100 [soil metagenome]